MPLSFTLHLTFWLPLLCLFFAGDSLEKESGQTSQLLAPQGFSDLSLLCHKGTQELYTNFGMFSVIHIFRTLPVQGDELPSPCTGLYPFELKHQKNNCIAAAISSFLCHKNLIASYFRQQSTLQDVNQLKYYILLLFCQVGPMVQQGRLRFCQIHRHPFLRKKL